MAADLEAMLWQALASPYGIEVECEDFQKTSQALYRAKAKVLEPRFDQLQFRRHPDHPDHGLWIVKLSNEGGAGNKPRIENAEERG
jgi:hypothetical protein